MSNPEPVPEYTRLHITPLNPSLLTTIIPASILPSARNISYHSIQTFPENSYGYVDLPMADAERIKKKLNGSILKGTKVRIEKAWPKKEAASNDVDEVERPKERKKRKRDQLEVPGIDIGERRVKRGWTVPTKDKGKGKEKDKVAKSKFTTQAECLFKTLLPPNKVANAKGGLKKNKDKKKGKETLVHEFERTVKYATFLRAPGGKKSKGVVEYIEGKGWVDQDGNVVEVVKIRKTPAKLDPKPAAKEELMAESSSEESSDEDEEAGVGDSDSNIPDNKGEDDSSSGDSSSDEGSDHKDAESCIQASKVDEDNSEESLSEDSSSEEESDHVPVASSSKATKTAFTSSETSSESSEEESSSESEDEPEEPQSAITSRPQSSSGPGLTIKIPGSTTLIASSVHPLEAIYKRKTDEKPNAGSFSFFEGKDGDDIELETHLQVPLTPFTQRDFEFRGIRSAAPTPDTAHPNKRFLWPTDNDDDDDEGEANSPIREAKGKEKEAEPESDFQKWFWENREMSIGLGRNEGRSWQRRRGKGRTGRDRTVRYDSA